MAEKEEMVFVRLLLTLALFLMGMTAARSVAAACDLPSWSSIGAVENRLHRLIKLGFLSEDIRRLRPYYETIRSVRHDSLPIYGKILDAARGYAEVIAKPSTEEALVEASMFFLEERLHSVTGTLAAVTQLQTTEKELALELLAIAQKRLPPGDLAAVNEEAQILLRSAERMGKHIEILEQRSNHIRKVLIPQVAARAHSASQIRRFYGPTTHEDTLEIEEVMRAADDSMLGTTLPTLPFVSDRNLKRPR